MAKAKPTPKKPARRPGRQPKLKKVVTEAMLRRIEDLHLRGFSLRDIAAIVEIHPTTVLDKINKVLRPEWKDAQVTRIEDDLARVAQLERVAWQAWEDSQKPERHESVKLSLLEPEEDKKPKRKTSKKKAAKANQEAVAAALEAAGADLSLVERSVQTITRDGNKSFLDIVRWCLEFRSKVGGYFEKDTAGATGEVVRAVEVVVESPEQIDHVMEFDAFQHQLVIKDKSKVIDVPPKK